MTTQKKVVAMLRGAAETIPRGKLDPPCELVEDWRFANVGTLTVQPRDALTPLVTLKVNFQDSYCSITVKGADPEHGPGVVGSGYLVYRSAEFPIVISRVQEHIRQKVLSR